MAATRYFFTTNAIRPIRLEGRDYKFVPLSVLGGRVSGVFDTEDPQDIAILTRASDQKIGIREISGQEAEHAKKKLKANPKASANLLPNESKPPRVLGKAGPLFSVESADSVASDATPKQKHPNGEITTPKVTSLVRTGKVNPPQPLVAEKDRMLRSRLNK